MEKTIDGEKTSEAFWSSFRKATEDKLTALEMEDLTVEGTGSYNFYIFWLFLIKGLCHRVRIFSAHATN